jgi:hypothetical protein
MPYDRQSPGRSARWGDVEFQINPDGVTECDFWVVGDNLARTERAICPPENTIFVLWEPPSISGVFNSYDPRVLAQFGTIVACQRSDIQHPHILFTQQFHPWHVGQRREQGKVVGYSMDYDYWCKLDPPPKKKLISVIASGKNMCEGHRLRLEFARKLQDHFKDQIDWYGSGVREIPDKWDAIADYKYHVAIENSVVPHYWSEKFADPLLGWAMPVYYGCPLIGSYFPADSHIAIDINDPAGAIRSIEQAVAENRYENSLPALREARERLLNRYNFFPAIIEICRSIDRGGKPRPVTLKHRFDSIASRVIRRVREYLPKGR